MATPQDVADGCAGAITIMKQFPLELLRDTTRDNPLTCLGGRLRVAVADAYTHPTHGASLQQGVLQQGVLHLAPSPTLQHRAHPPVPHPPARREMLPKRATPVDPLSDPPPPKAVVAGPRASGTGAAAKKPPKKQPTKQPTKPSKPKGLSWHPLNQLNHQR